MADPVQKAKHPRVSIAFPVYNGERTLESALESLAAQTYRDFEILIFDNASTDGTEALCRAFASRHPNVVYHRNERNLGAAGNYNLALRTARGELFKWMACDDTLDPGFLEACVEWLDDGGQETVMVFPKRRFVDPDGAPYAPDEFEPAKRIEHGGRMVRELTYREMVRWPHGRGPLNNIAPAVVFGVFRRDVALRTRGIGGFIGGDLVFNAEMALLGRIWQVPEVLWSNRLHAQDSWRWRLTRREQAEWYNPASRRGSRFRNLVLLSEYLRSIARLERRPARAGVAAAAIAGLAGDEVRRSLRRWLGALRVVGLARSRHSRLPARMLLSLRRVRRQGIKRLPAILRSVRRTSDQDLLVELASTALARRNPDAFDLLVSWMREPAGSLHRGVAERVLKAAGQPDEENGATALERKIPARSTG